MVSLQHHAREDQADRMSLTSQSDVDIASPDRINRRHSISTIDEDAPSTPKAFNSVAAAVSDPQTEASAQTTTTPTTPNNPRRRPSYQRRPGSAASNLSIESLREGRGIKIGAAKPVGGVITSFNTSGTATSSSDEAPKGF